jgi:hypothetical protein
MSVKAFILVDTSPGKAREVATKLRQVAGISSAHAVTAIIANGRSQRRFFARRIGGARKSEACWSIAV